MKDNNNYNKKHSNQFRDANNRLEVQIVYIIICVFRSTFLISENYGFFSRKKYELIAFNHRPRSAQRATHSLSTFDFFLFWTCCGANREADFKKLLNVRIKNWISFFFILNCWLDWYVEFYIICTFTPFIVGEFNWIKLFVCV